MTGHEETTVEELGRDLVRVTVADQEFVIDAACPHRGGRLAHGYVNPRTLRITCPLHRTSFDLATGCVMAGPAAGRLTVHHAGPVGGN
ncbi:Rieske (2Fe-2S) protein [Kitasatospora viridis]|uniref:Rieske-like 2Fe-2S protein n=1 Tax=Kitasatospora viridis TaxID=281105 RepID=A0A561UPA6_9ACTN|nr:Rieske 2Fe-2S domain-containing protein [Kitasatospora viridis]TWG01208.1 Rieske-like 2Fe-2S protein [Kitasatospora viridis]